MTDPTPRCPRCGAPGQRLGERPLDGRTVWRCLACGRIWPERRIDAPRHYNL